MNSRTLEWVTLRGEKAVRDILRKLRDFLYINEVEEPFIRKVKDWKRVERWVNRARSQGSLRGIGTLAFNLYLSCGGTDSEVTYFLTIGWHRTHFYAAHRYRKTRKNTHLRIMRELGTSMLVNSSQYVAPYPNYRESAALYLITHPELDCPYSRRVLKKEIKELTQQTDEEEQQERSSQHNERVSRPAGSSKGPSEGYRT